MSSSSTCRVPPPGSFSNATASILLTMVVPICLVCLGCCPFRANPVFESMVMAMHACCRWWRAQSSPSQGTSSLTPTPIPLSPRSPLAARTPSCASRLCSHAQTPRSRTTSRRTGARARRRTCSGRPRARCLGSRGATLCLQCHPRTTLPFKGCAASRVLSLPRVLSLLSGSPSQIPWSAHASQGHRRSCSMR